MYECGECASGAGGRERSERRVERKRDSGLLSHVHAIPYARAGVRVKSVLSHGHACARYVMG